MQYVSFKQDNYMTINENLGAIQVNGVSCGTTEGMTAIVKTANYTDLVVQNVKSDTTGLTINMLQNGAVKTFTSGAYVTQYLKGTSVTLTESATGDTIVIGIGKVNLEVDTEAKRNAVSIALQNALQSNQASSFVVGSKVTQTLGVALNSMKWSTLTSGASLTVADQTNAATASTTLSGIVNTLNKEIAQTAAYDKMVDSLIQQNKVSQQNLTSSIQQLVEIDISEVRNELDIALERITSCVAALQAEKTSKTAVQLLLRI